MDLDFNDLARQNKCSANLQDFQTIDSFDAFSMPVMLLHTLSIHLSNLLGFCSQALAETEPDVAMPFPPNTSFHTVYSCFYVRGN